MKYSSFHIPNSSFFVTFSLILVFFSALPAAGQEFTSTNFQVLDPVIQPGGYSTSSSFRLNGVIGQIAIGTSTVTNFQVSRGFLFYPQVSPPVVTATAGEEQVALSWTASEGFLGWTVSGYSYGQATVSGGPYTFSSSLGNVTSKTVTGLTADTTYYFIIRTQDALGNVIATSTEVSVVPTAPAPAPAPSPAPSGGGGG